MYLRSFSGIVTLAKKSSFCIALPVKLVSVHQTLELDKVTLVHF